MADFCGIHGEGRNAVESEHLVSMEGCHKTRHARHGDIILSRPSSVARGSRGMRKIQTEFEIIGKRSDAALLGVLLMMNANDI